MSLRVVSVVSRRFKVGSFEGRSKPHFKKNTYRVVSF